MGDFYSFTTSDAEGSAEDILKVMHAINSTLEQIASDVSNLEEEWTGSESVLYSDANRRWREGAHEIKSILQSVSGALTSVNEGNSALRKSVTLALQKMR